VELMRALTDNELVAAMIADVKLSKAGLQAAMAQAKKSRKAAHKVKSTLQALDG
jgi:hypothetical protein